MEEQLHWARVHRCKEADGPSLFKSFKSGGSLKSSQAYLTELTKMSKVSVVGRRRRKSGSLSRLLSRPMLARTDEANQKGHNSGQESPG